MVIDCSSDILTPIELVIDCTSDILTPIQLVIDCASDIFGMYAVMFGYKAYLWNANWMNLTMAVHSRKCQDII